MDAKKGRFYAALYRGGERLGDFLDAAPEELAAALAAALREDEPVLLAGPAAPLVREQLAFPAPDRLFVDPEGKRGKARELLDLIQKNGMFGTGEEVFSGPFYLRKSDAELNLTPDT
jgi:tRNA threonylcarbamoyladenosine biosynthesis protein TsaB